MQIDRPFRLVTPTVDGDVLAVLARADAEFTPPEVRDLIGDYSPEGVRRSLRRLVEQGIVLDRRAGNAWLYRLNRAHLGAPAVMSLTDLRSELVTRLRERIDGWPVAAAYAALFGSAVDGRMEPSSDIDLFVARLQGVAVDDDGWRSQLDALAADVASWTGNDVRILEYSAAEVTKGLAGKDRVLGEVNAHGLRIAGPMGYLNRRTRSA